MGVESLIRKFITGNLYYISMKIAVIIVALMLGSINIYAQSPTLLGTHGSNSPQILQNLGVQIARYGFTDYDIKKSRMNGGTNAFDKARILDALNIEQVVHLTWPDTTSVNEYERIPRGADSIEVFQYLDTLIDEIGTYIEYRAPLLIDFFQKTKRNNELQGIFFLNS